jgi:hypothetical protein
MNDDSALCEFCGDEIADANVEAFELTGQLLCDECADGVFEDIGQFGVGA